MGKDKTHQWLFRWPIYFMLLLIVGSSWTATEDGLSRALPSTLDASLGGLVPTELVTLTDLNGYTEQLLESAEADMFKSFMAEHKRIIRNILSSNSMVVLDVQDAGAIEFPDTVQRIVKLQTQSGLFLVVFLNDPALELYEVSNGQHHKIFKINLGDAEWNYGVQHIFLVTAYVTEANLWVVWCTDKYKVYAYCFNRNPSAKVHEQFIVEHRAITALKLFKVDNQLCLIIATDNAGISSYYLNVNYFDKKEQNTLNFNGVTSVETFEMHKRTYLLLTSSSYKQGLGLCSFNSGKMECTRPVDLPHVNQAIHYTDMQFLEDHTMQNHYIIFTSSVGNHNIYYISHGKLLFLQQLEADKDEYLTNEDASTSIAVIQTPLQEMFICIVVGQKVSLYVENKDAEFQLDTTFIVPAVVTEVYLNYIMGEGIQIYLVYDGTNPSIGIWKVATVDRQPVRDDLAVCLENLDNVLTAREEDLSTLESYIEEKKEMKTSGNQVWEEPLYIQSLEVKNTANLKNVTMARTEMDTYLSKLADNVQLIMTEVDDLQQQAKILLLDNVNQNFETPLGMSTVVVSRAKVNMMHINHMNGIPLAYVEEVVLLEDVKQRVDTPINFYKLEASSLVSEVGRDVKLGGIALQDFVHDDVDLFLHGLHYFSNVSAGDIMGLNSSQLIINDIQTDLVVTSHSDPVFMDNKILNNLTVVENTTLDNFNNMNFEIMADEVIRTDLEVPMYLEGSLIFLGTLKANRNFHVLSLNFYNLSTLYYNAVKTKGLNIIKGPVVFETQVVAENCSTETINGVRWHEIVLESSSFIASSFVADQVHIMRDLKVDMLNNISLHEVALDGLNTHVTGRIEFRGPVTVYKNFTMEANATIGDVDPSNFNIFRNITTLLIEDSTLIADSLNITNNLSALLVDGVNLTSLPEMFWSKTIPQTINHFINLTSVVFRNNVSVGTLNDKLPSDYLQVEEHQNITGYYHFQSNVTVGNISMHSGVLMDQVDVSEISKDVMTIGANQIIFTEMNFFDGLLVNVEMNLSSINGIHPDDFMLLDGDQKHTGMLMVTTATVMQLHSNSDVWLQETLNGYTLDLVLEIYDGNGSDPLSSNVNVDELLVNELILEDLVDAVDFNMFMQSSLKTIAPKQYVTTNLTVNHCKIWGWLSIEIANGQNWIEYTNDVLQRNVPGEVLGTKRFLEVNEVVGYLSAGTVNGRNITKEASRLMSKTSDQYIPDYLVFEDDVSIGHLKAEMVNGINLSRILYIDSDFQVDNLNMDSLVFKGNVGAPHDILDDCDIGKLEEMLKWMNEGIVDVDTLVLVDHLAIIGNVSTSVDLIASGKTKEAPFNMGHLTKYIVHGNIEQIITGPIFIESAVIQDLNAGTINEVDMHRLFTDTASKNIQEIRCSLNFASDLEVNNVKVNYAHDKEDSTNETLHFNGLNLPYLKKIGVKIKGDMTVEGSKTFSSQPTFNNLVATGGLNGYYAEDLVVLNKTVQSYCNFKAGVKATILEVRGKVHGENPSNILSDRYTLDSWNIKNLSFTNMIIKGEVNVPEVNNVVLKNLILRNKGSKQLVHGSKYFKKGLFVEGNIWVDMTFNDLYVDKLKSVVKVDEAAVIPGTVVFEKSVNAHDGLMLGGPASQLDSMAMKNDLYDIKNSVHQQHQQLKMLSSNLTDAFEDLLEEIPTLYSELSSVSFKFPIAIGGVSRLQYNHIQKHIYATVKKSDCSHELECACSSVVHKLKMQKDGSLTPLDSRKTGDFFVIMDPSNAYIYYDFTTNCNVTHTVTTMRKLSYSKENTILTSHKLPWNGAATNVLSFTEDITYFVILSQVSVNYNKVRSCIYIVGSSNDTSVEPRTYQTLQQEDMVADIDMAVVGEKRWVLVTVYQSYGSRLAEKANSTLYLWNRDDRKLEKPRLLLTDHATCGRLVPSNFINMEPYTVFGQMKKPPALHKHVEELEVLHIWDGASVSSMQTAAWGINFMEVLNIDQETYLLLLSSLHDKISVFRLVLGNGFYKILDLDFINPQTAKVIEHDGVTYVLVASSTTIISFQIHTKGVSGNPIHKEMWNLLNTSVAQ
ncbi:female sterile (1) M3 [Oratosquilla oratoria]|uniref:female sterile (1) M3 n=1 Tax=Oratosquilla oratoria TaxID=337810 RepID=UPI003F776775